MDNTETPLAWRRSDGCAGGDCVEVANLPDGGVAVRNSHGGPALTFTRGEWEQFLAGAHRGEFDLPADAGQS